MWRNARGRRLFTSGSGKVGLVRRALLLLFLCSAGCDDGSSAGTDPDALVQPDAGPVDASVDAAAPDGLVPSEEDRAWAEAAAQTINEDWLLERVTALADDEMAGRGNLQPGGERARAWIIEQLEAAGVEPFGDDDGWTQAFVEGVNVVGVRRGTDPVLADEYVLVGAHYDHLGRAGDPGSQCTAAAGDAICNGAIDNASGSTAVLAIARALGEPGGGPRRSVVVALFDAEEDGLLGSRHFVSSGAPVEAGELVAMFNLDMVGASIIPGAASSFALGVEYTTGLADRVLHNAEHAGIVTYPVSSFFDGSDDGERSDHHSFRVAGVPALFFSSGAPPVYHSPADEVGQLEPDKLMRTTRHVFLTLTDVANAGARPEFVDPPMPHIGDARALLELGELVVANPDALGIDPNLVGIVESWLEKLRGYIATPPTTEAGWAEYEAFVRSVIRAVVNAAGL